MNAPTQTLKFASSARVGAALDFQAAAKFSPDGSKAFVVLHGDGFEASRYLTAEDLEEIREWIDKLIAARSESALRTIREGDAL